MSLSNAALNGAARELAPFPHRGGCPQCRDERRCNFCGELARAGHCTNGRCLSCHAARCTPGGNTDDGHHFGTVGTVDHWSAP